ncbi:MAG: DNA repair protein RecN, partial [Salibacteraceae bacterium]
KKIHASVASTPTLILDEIDTGISGEVAAKTAQMLSEMANDSQIVSITHLPQVAGKANHHQEVSKSTKGDKTSTTLRSLTNEERKLEIARMLSGEELSEAALQNAEQLMQ